ncbi:hypothetical protein FD755_024124 [Muntiacus reevesi]|uniref:Uncharacterized protein n=1 Tax=Muntiacus reevesi TaxID=9886 RepID=A0A5N3VW15_MUNRE|nr:hypothetical protein FD755_024124 [Muntiacus reevesi]
MSNPFTAAPARATARAMSRVRRCQRLAGAPRRLSSVWRQRKEGEALEEGEMERIGQEVRLLVEKDSPEEQLSSQEPKEKLEQEHARPGTPSDLPDHTGGAGVTGVPSGSEFSSGNVKDHRAYIRIRWNNRQRKGQHGSEISTWHGMCYDWLLDLRWTVNNRQLSVMISEQDEILLSCISGPAGHCQVSFRSKPYFRNTVIIKEYYLDITDTTCLPGWCGWVGYTPCHCTPVHWFWVYKWGALSRRLETSSLNFLNWLLDHNSPGSNRKAEMGLLWASAELASYIISEDLWVDLLQYFPER